MFVDGMCVTGANRQRGSGDRWLARGIVLAAVLGLAPQTAAAVKLGTGPAPERVTETTTAPTGRLLITLSQPPDGPAAVLRPEPHFRHTASSDSVPALWTRFSDGSAPDAQGVLLLSAGETATFEVRGSFPRAGVWESAIDVLGPDGAVAGRFILAMTRSLAPLPRDLLLEPRPAGIDLPFPAMTTGEAHRITLVGRNTANEPVEISRVGVGRLARMSGQTEMAAAVTEPPRAETTDCRGSLEAQQDCSLSLLIPAGLSPARYLVDTYIAGQGGGQSLRTQQIAVRLSPWWVGLLVALGAMFGSLVDTWRKSGRQALGARIAVADRSRQALALAEAATRPEARHAARALLDQLRALDERIRRGSEATIDLAPFDTRLSAIIAAIAAEAAARQIPDPAAKLLAPQREALASALYRADETDAGPSAARSSTAIADAALALRQDAARAEALLQAAQAADAALAEVSAPLRLLLAEPALCDAWTALDEARAGAFDPASDIAARTADLTKRMQEFAALCIVQLPGIATKLLSLARAAQGRTDAPAPQQAVTQAVAAAEALDRGWPTLLPDQRLSEANKFAAAHVAVLQQGGPEAAAASEATRPTLPSLLPVDTALTLDFGALLRGPTGATSLEELEAYRGRWDIWTNAAVLVGIGVVGVLVLWVDNPSWGAPADLAGALLAGVGTRLAVGVVAQRA